MLDNFPEWNWFTPFASCSYDINKWKNNIGLTFFHEQKNDSLRLSFQQKIFGALDILAQWWYDTNYDKHFSWAITLNANLWQWFWLQANCKRERDGKIVLTSGVIYQFSK